MAVGSAVRSAPADTPTRLDELLTEYVPHRHVRTGNRMRRRRLPPLSRSAQFHAATAVAIGLVVGIRALVQIRWGEPTGMDTGNWLTLGHAWLGDGLVQGAQSTYPPVVPVAAVLLESVLGPLGAMVLLGAVATAVYGGCTALMLWRAGCGWWSLIIGVLLAAGSAAGEAIAWGGTPQLLALGLAAIVLFLVAELLVAPRRRVAWALGATTVLLGATSHLVLAEAAAASLAMGVLRLAGPLSWPGWRRAAAVVGVWGRAVAPCLLLVPLYLNLASTVGDSFAERRQTQSAADLLRGLEVVTRDFALLWQALTVFALLIPVLLWRRRTEPLWLLSGGLAVVMLAATLVSPEPRFAYLVPLLVAGALGLVASGGPMSARSHIRWSARLGVAGLLVTSTFGGLARFEEQVAYYGGLVPRGTMTALDSLRERTAPHDVVVVPPVQGGPFGWWVEGYAQRAAFVGSSGEWLNFARERARAATSVRLFSAGDVFSRDWFDSARREGVDVVYVPSAYDGLTRRGIAARIGPRDELVLYSSEAATIVEVP